MFTLKASLLASTGVLGVAATGTAGAYFWTYETIWDSLAEDLIPESSASDNGLSGIWNTLQSQIPEEGQIKTASLKEVKKDQSNKEKRLEKWCFEAYKATYKNLFYKTDENLKSDVKAVCMITIKSKLGADSLLKTGDEDKSEYEKNLEALKKNWVKDSPILEATLITIKNSNTDDDWKKLQSWCQETYERGYQGENANRVKLVHKLCKKQPASEA